MSINLNTQATFYCCCFLLWLSYFLVFLYELPLTDFSILISTGLSNSSDSTLTNWSWMALFASSLFLYTTNPYLKYFNVSGHYTTGQPLQYTHGYNLATYSHHFVFYHLTIATQGLKNCTGMLNAGNVLWKSKESSAWCKAILDCFCSKCL